GRAAGGCSQRGCGGGCHDEGMDLRTLLREIGARIVPDPAPAMGWWLLLALVAALGAVLLPPLWRLARLAVTIVHELGHAAVRSGRAAGGCSQRGCGGGCHDEGMDLRTLLREIGARIVPDPAPAMGWWLLLALVAALGAVLLPPLWRLARLAVTIVHELGHAAV